jgi:hypothetical protein
VSDPVDVTAGTWHEQAPAVAAAAAEELRIGEDHPDRERFDRKARAACVAIDMRLELRPATGRMFYPVTDVWAVTSYASGQAPADVLEAAVQLTEELYRRKDAPFGISNAWSPTGEALRISRDHLAGVEPLLLPHVEGWGLA